MKFEMTRMIVHLALLGITLLHWSDSKSLGNDGDQFPIGTILSWKPNNELNSALPCGWELCNGQLIEDTSSPLFGKRIPSLNTDNLFLRGASSEDDLGIIQGDTIPEHGHKSLGHTHIDSGHTHIDKGHEHELKVKIPYPVLAPGSEHGDGNGGPHWAATGHYPPFENRDDKLSKANIQNGHSQISEGHADVTGVVDARTSSETRPKNVKYPYIMKVSDEPCASSTSEVSTIVGWLPSEQGLDSTTWKESEGSNQQGVFLRGGLQENAGEFEMDSMQEHSHKDLGHSHVDEGHHHEDLGHSHQMSQVYDVLRPGNTWGDQDGGPHFGSAVDMDPSVEIGYADIQIANADIQVGKETIENVINTEVGAETRPDNIQVVWIEGNPKLSPGDFPIGSILAWLPTKNVPIVQKLPFGWAECSGDLNGVPDINGKQLFLRGGESRSAGQIEEAQLQDHKHNDLGHKHEDLGHSHIDSGHSLGEYKILVPGDDYGDSNGGPYFAEEEIIDIFKTQLSKANLATSRADIRLSTSLIRDVTHAQTSHEVRPKNMGVKFIIKLF